MPCPPLCRKFLNPWKCIGCPVSFHTAASRCANTPYEEFSECAVRMMLGEEVHKNEVESAALGMKDFLLGLLKKEVE